MAEVQEFETFVRNYQNMVFSVAGRRPRHYSDAIIYEVHIRGFTQSESSGISSDKRGTFAGLIEKIPYLQELGVTIVELSL
jgi:pullulanase/glycogen debranching enzyme